MSFATPRALEMALKAEARKSPMETNAAIASFYRHRLLCRVFLGSEGEFILKGGQSMLARTIDARATRDIDLLASESSLDKALARLVELASTDLGDFFSFELAKTRPIKAEDKYREGVCVTFDALIGQKRAAKVSVDLVVDSAFEGQPEAVSPKDRIELEGIPACDYLAYPVLNAIADKVSATLEVHDGRPSSRVKDLVDLVIFARREHIDGAEACRVLTREMAVRGIGRPDGFAVPSIWHDSYQSAYAKLASLTGLEGDCPDIEAAEFLVKNLIDPVLNGSAAGKRWDPSMVKWQKNDEVRAIRIMLDYLQGPIWTSDPETGKPETGISIIDSDEKLRKLNYEIQDLYDSYYEFDSNDEACWFNEEQEKQDKQKMLDLLGKLRTRLDELNDGSYEINDLATPHYEGL